MTERLREPTNRTVWRARASGTAGTMIFGTSIFLIAAGAILKFAVTDTLDGINLETVGVILMIAGALGILLSLLVAPPWRRDVVTEDRPVVGDRTRYRR